MLWPLIAAAIASPVVTLDKAILTLPSGAVVSAESAQTSGEALTGAGINLQKGPLRISSDSTEWALSGEKGHFVGNVRAVQGDLEFSCERIDVELAPDGTIRNAIATGTVLVKQEGREAKGEQATFSEGRLVLSGKASVRQGSGEMTGEKIIFVVGQETIECIQCTMILKTEIDP